MRNDCCLIDYYFAQETRLVFSLELLFGDECRSVFQCAVLGSRSLSRFGHKCDTVAHFQGVPSVVEILDPFSA